MNIILIVADCLRADYVYEAEKYGLRLTNLEWLRANGVSFTQDITVAPWTNPSISSMLTGVYPFKLTTYKYRGRIPANRLTLQSYFMRNGFSVGSFLNTKGLFGNSDIAEVGTTRDIPDILKWIEKNAHKPFFLFLHYWQTHPPYFYRYSKESWYRGKDEVVKILKEGKRGIEIIKRRYANAVERFSEEFLEAIIDCLGRLKILDDTLMIITGDHGESFGERLSNIEELYDIFVMHGQSLYDEVLRVPLILWGPSLLKGKMINYQVRSLDIYATVFDVTQNLNDLPPDVDSISLRPLWEGKEKGDRIALSSTTYAYYPEDSSLEVFSKYAIRDGVWKLIIDKASGSQQLYNLREDPYEEHNVIEKYSKEKNRLLRIFEHEVKLTEDTEEDRKSLEKQLRDLGYL